MNRPLQVQIDGVAGSAVDVLDRGLHYGDGLFETIACRDARPCLLNLHLQRLSEGCARLGIVHPDLPALAGQVRDAAATTPRSIIKLIVTRGSATARGYGAHGDEAPRTLLLQYGWSADPDPQAQEGAVVRIAHGRLGENPLLAGLKHLNRLEQVLIRNEWNDPGIHEALVFGSSGALISGTMSNVFLVRNARIMTPAITRAGVRGVMRRAVLREAEHLGLAAEESTLSAADLDEAQEIFLTNARIGIWPVRRLEQRTLGIGPTTRQLQHVVHALLERGDA
jgi:4-amino-4-deoxychorismate lyase